MGSFHYRVLDRDGEVQTGLIDAVDMPTATAELHRRGWMPIELSAGGKTLSMRLNEPVHLFGKPNQRDIFSFLRDLARLLRAGLSLDDALKLQIDMQNKDLFIRVLTDVREQVRRGESLAASLSKHKDVFSIQIIASVQAGESSGQLPEALNMIAGTMERSLSFKERLRSALIYPTILMIMVVATFFLVMTFVIPQFGPLFDGQEDKLPWVTRFVMDMAGMFSAYWWILAVVVSCVLVWLIWAVHNSGLRKGLWETASNLPILGKWVLMPSIIRFTRTLGVCSQSGLALDKAIAMAIDTVRIPHAEAEFLKVKTLVRRGEHLSAALKKIVWFPALTLQFVRVGEQSGNLGDMLTEAAEIMAHDYEAKLEKALEIFSPVLTLLMGGVVALLVGSVLLGIMSINDVAL
jgi:general secretion pathway protein F